MSNPVLFESQPQISTAPWEWALMTSTLPSAFTVGSLYLAAFAQARSPHIGLIIPTSEKSGHLVHIRIDRDVSDNWVFQTRTEHITGNMFLTSLLKIHDVSAGEVTLDQLKMAAGEVAVPDNDRFGECGSWVFRVIEQLGKVGVLDLVDVQELRKEFNEFAAGNRNFARREKFPNVDTSKWCM
ncbi:hypothetical protein CVT25_007305 [Psilocybe cyanescens]|uniref:Uncharacterized protein n=1 Tax=Psilocybe cyanescens TaxID=93625 RepID=A0A409XP79_PSICY|nr:hypothetical protein CVT25_007305 [Psilocybe cyanescens]